MVLLRYLPMNTTNTQCITDIGLEHSCHPRPCFADAIRGANEEIRIPATHLILQCDEVKNSAIPKIEKGFRSGIYAI
jgi:hypothetical protein